MFRFFKKLFSRDGLGDRAAKKFNIPSQSKKICAFSDDEQTLIIVTKDGMYFKKSLEEKGGRDDVNGVPLLQEMQ